MYNNIYKTKQANYLHIGSFNKTQQDYIGIEIHHSSKLHSYVKNNMTPLLKLISSSTHRIIQIKHTLSNVKQYHLLLMLIARMVDICHKLVIRSWIWLQIGSNTIKINIYILQQSPLIHYPTKFSSIMSNPNPRMNPSLPDLSS